MKRFALFVMGLLFICFVHLTANPLVALFLNELLLDPEDSYGWRLEMTNNWNFVDGQYLTSSSGQSVITGYSTIGNYAVITNENLERRLSINFEGDIVQLHDRDGSLMDEIRFGRVEQPFILAPEPGMSLSLHNEVIDESQEYFRYFDASPTIGADNDSVNGRGALRGHVYDVTGMPLADVDITAYFSASMQYFYQLETRTAEDGSFYFESYARLDSLRFSKEGYQEEIRRQQIWPDSTTEMETVFMQVLNAMEGEKPLAKPGRNYRLYDNYPNPFNASTLFSYDLPFSDKVEIVIYNLQGKKVETLFSGYQKYGRHFIHWNAGYLASGIYIYQLRTSAVILQKKCLLIK